MNCSGCRSVFEATSAFALNTKPVFLPARIGAIPCLSASHWLAPSVELRSISKVQRRRRLLARFQLRRGSDASGTIWDTDGS